MVWWARGRELHAVEPEPHRPAARPSDAVLAFEPQLLAAGCDVRVEHGALIGEVLGLEVARVVEPADAPPRLEVGVGRHDREAFAIIHGDLPTDAALAEVVAAVRRHRRAGAPEHPCTGWPPSAGCATSSSPTPGSSARRPSPRPKVRCRGRT